MRRNIFEFIFLFAAIGFLMMYVLSNSNKTLATIESSANSSMSDVFGIRKIYETKPGGFEWYMNMEDPKENRRLYNYDKIKESGDNSYNIGDRSRLSVYSEDGIGNNEGNMDTYDFSKLPEKGYWHESTDWKNVEITGEYHYRGGEGPGITLLDLKTILHCMMDAVDPVTRTKYISMGLVISIKSKHILHLGKCHI